MKNKITIVPVEARTKVLEQMVNKGSLDLAFTATKRDTPTDSEKITLLTEELVLVVPKNHRLAKKAAPAGSLVTRIDLAEIRDNRFVLPSIETTLWDIIDDLFRKTGYEPQVLFETTNINAIVNMVASGISLAIVPYYFVQMHSDVAHFSLQLSAHWEINACYRKDSYLNNASRYFIKLAKEYWTKDYYLHDS